MTFEVVSNDSDASAIEVPAVFASSTAGFYKRVQFSLTKDMRGLIEAVQAKFEFQTLSAVFQSAFGLLYHVLSYNIENARLVVEKDDGSTDEPNIVSILLYTGVISVRDIKADRYQIMLDQTQFEHLLSLQDRMGLTSLSDVARQAIIMLFAIGQHVNKNDKLILITDGCEYELAM